MLPRPRCLPRNQPSPKPSSSSTSEILSPLLRVNSSALLASKSSAHSQHASLEAAIQQKTYGQPPRHPLAEVLLPNYWNYWTGVDTPSPDGALAQG